jgi:hypothetical protein
MNRIEYRKTIDNIKITSYADLALVVPEEDQELFKQKCIENKTNFKSSVESIREQFLDNLAECFDSKRDTEGTIIRRFKRSCVSNINMNYKLSKGTYFLSQAISD